MYRAHHPPESLTDPSQELLDALAAIYGTDAAPGLVERMGMRFHGCPADGSRLVMSMPVSGNTQSLGYLHGGASAALAETAGSVAAALQAGPHRYALGVDLSITHHRSARSGWVIAVATPLYCGHTLATHSITITDEPGQLVATARITNAIRPRRTLQEARSTA